MRTLCVIAAVFLTTSAVLAAEPPAVDDGETTPRRWQVDTELAEEAVELAVSALDPHILRAKVAELPELRANVDRDDWDLTVGEVVQREVAAAVEAFADIDMYLRDWTIRSGDGTEVFWHKLEPSFFADETSIETEAIRLSFGGETVKSSLNATGTIKAFWLDLKITLSLRQSYFGPLVARDLPASATKVVKLAAAEGEIVATHAPPRSRPAFRWSRQLMMRFLAFD